MKDANARLFGKSKNDKEMKTVKIYTDGACSGNPGAGGWATILIYGGREKILTGYEEDTTNNRMELSAVIFGLKALKEPCLVDIYTDSAYCVNAFKSGWLINWQLNGWKNANKEEVKNRDLWEELLNLTAVHKIKWNKVKGHSDNELNNRCDELARGAIVKA
jgi:ribonuclease HI